MMFDDYADHMSGWGWLGMSVGIVVFWGLLVLVVVVLVRGLGRDESRPSAPAPARLTAEQVLAERFARGEIGAEEYRARLATLRGKAVS